MLAAPELHGICATEGPRGGRSRDWGPGLASSSAVGVSLSHLGPSAASQDGAQTWREKCRLPSLPFTGWKSGVCPSWDGSCQSLCPCHRPPTCREWGWADGRWTSRRRVSSVRGSWTETRRRPCHTGHPFLNWLCPWPALSMESGDTGVGADMGNWSSHVVPVLDVRLCSVRVMHQLHPYPRLGIRWRRADL